MNLIKQKSVSNLSMLKYCIVLFLPIAMLSCASPNSFQSFYNQHKSEADWALAFPKYMAMVAIPKEDKEEVRRFSEGMRKIRVLLNETDSDQLMASFSSFAEGKNYTPYIVVKKDGSSMDLYAREEGEHIREIVLDIRSDDGAFIIGLLGKMEKANFQKALKEVSN